MMMTRFTGSPKPEVRSALIVDEVWNRVHSELHRDESPLLDNEEAQQGLASTVRKILESVISQLAGGVVRQPRLSAPASGNHAADHVGAERAQQQIHPSASLAAADTLFSTALPVLVTHASDFANPAPSTERIATTLHEEISAIVTPASVDYVDVLLDRLSVAHSEERRQISRDLHDRVAQSIAAAAQRLAAITTALNHSSDADAPARGCAGGVTLGSDAVALARDALALLNESLAETRAIATELRQSVGDRTLCEALSEWAQTLLGNPACLITETGVAGRLAPSAREEAFMIVREFIRNARRHSGSDRIDVRIDWLADRAEFTVVDRGHGFATDEIRAGAMGLVAARERSEIVGGSIRIDSEPGAGTRATLAIPVKAA